MQQHLHLQVVGKGSLGPIRDHLKPLYVERLTASSFLLFSSGCGGVWQLASGAAAGGSFKGQEALSMLLSNHHDVGDAGHADGW